MVAKYFQFTGTAKNKQIRGDKSQRDSYMMRRTTAKLQGDRRNYSICGPNTAIWK